MKLLLAFQHSAPRTVVVSVADCPTDKLAVRTATKYAISKQPFAHVNIAEEARLNVNEVRSESSS